jgi:hypothetical protein
MIVNHSLNPSIVELADHGGFKTFLKWRSIPESDYRAFYDLKSDVYQDFLLYLQTIFNHVNRYTQVK